jgi:hypothetical protein
MVRRALFPIRAVLTRLTVACTNPVTPAGHEGYVFERPRVLGKGGLRGIVSGPGNFGRSLFRNGWPAHRITPPPTIPVGQNEIPWVYSANDSPDH